MTVLGHGVEVGAQAHPLDEVSERIAAQHACRSLAFLAGKRVACRRVRRIKRAFRRRRRLVEGVVVLVRLGELIDDAEELLDVLNTTARLVGRLGLKCCDEP